MAFAVGEEETARHGEQRHMTITRDADDTQNAYCPGSEIPRRA